MLCTLGILMRGNAIDILYDMRQNLSNPTFILINELSAHSKVDGNSCLLQVIPKTAIYTVIQLIVLQITLIRIQTNLFGFKERKVFYSFEGVKAILIPCNNDLFL